ncbi:GGDEF domain-containing protein [Rhodoferax saidenbachensis]|uniref:Diguanylate cyclase (GGDEF)-like protein n=1 Tax=Rhodoferax saidenbachensis TaxID=1484693 RepID=A0ABU1ZUW5_9BURK|nr:GGDEF domain-containing protein [Rhodoferax saidenbachensis]MDR7308326.1 diguanylate cyclase (GGDEF)-like protein [Rhodoferax saidenbachensis]
MTPSSAPQPAIPSDSLSAVLGQAEHVQALVDESALALSTLNSVLGQQSAQAQSQEVKQALAQSQAVEEKVQDASDKLVLVTQALEGEIKERKALDAELALVTQQEEVARYAALHDSLTGLPNRTLFNDRLEHSLAQARRHDLALAVMFLDLDGFKQVNDTYGHDVGDVVLKTIAERLKENTRNDDTVSRLGGDEFLYLLMGAADEQTVANLAQKTIHRVQLPCQLSTGNISVLTSIGISLFPRNGVTADALIKEADAAMYAAKRDRTGYAFAK